MMKIYDLNANYHHKNIITVFTNLTSKQQIIARTKKQNIAQFLPNIAQNIAIDIKQNFKPKSSQF